MKQRNADYGVQKIFGCFGGAVFGPLSGYITHYYSFSSVFHFYAFLQIIFVAVIFKSDLKFQRREHNKKEENDSGILKCLSSGDSVILFLASSAFLGLVWSFSETFVFLHLESVGFSRQNLGLTMASSTLLGILISMCSTVVLDTCGWRVGLTLSLGSYSIRFFGYSIIQLNSLSFLMFLECMKSVGNPWCMLVTGYFIKNHVHMIHISSFQSMFSALYFGIGKGLGSLVGGLIIGSIGSQLTFQVLSCLCASSGCFLLLVNFHNKQISSQKIKD